MLRLVRDPDPLNATHACSAPFNLTQSHSVLAFCMGYVGVVAVHAARNSKTSKKTLFKITQITELVRFPVISVIKS